MKTLKTIFLTLSLLIVGGGNYAKADPISDVSQFSNNKVYTINTARGAWTLNSEGTTICSTKKDNGANDNASADQTTEAQEFAIYQYDGRIYVYNLKASAFVVLNNGNTQVSPLLGTPLAFETTGNDSYPLKAGTLAKDRYVNNNNGGGVKIDGWTTTDDGNRLAIEEVRDLTSDEITTLEGLLASAPMSSHKSYVIEATRGTWCANAAGTSLATTATNPTPETGYNQFAIVWLEGVQYIYNVGSQKFIKKNGNLVEGRGDKIDIRLSGDAERPYMFYFPDGNIYFNMQGGGGSYAMNTYSTPDDGNKQSLEDANVDAYEAALAQYNRTTTVTYNLMYEGAQVGTDSQDNRLGVAPTLPASLDKGCFTYSYNIDCIQSNTTTVTATATPIFTISPDYVGATWYNMYIRQNDRWVPYSEDSEPYTPYAATDEDKATKELQWAFIGNPFTTGIKVVNRAAGRGKSLKNDGGNAVMRDGDTYWDIFGRNGGILLREQGTANNYINQAGGANGDFQFWNSSWAAGDNGSTMWLVEAPVETTTITYHVMYNGSEVATATATAVVDDPTPLTKIPAAFIQDYVNLEGDDTHIIEADDNIDLTATWTGPFEISADFANAHWYDMAIRSNWYVNSANTDGSGALVTVEANALGLGEDAYQWAFVGDPYHLKIYNKDKGSSLVFSAKDVETNQGIPAFQAEDYYWKIARSTTNIENSFLLNVPGTNLYINQYGGAGGSLKFWDSGNNIGDPGSAFKIFDVPTDYSTFLNDEITPYMGSGYFYFKESVKTDMGWDPAYATSCTLQQYKDMRDGYAAIDKSDLSNYELPETGYYRMKNVNYNKYLGLKATTVYGNYTGDDETSAATVVKLTKGTGDNAGKYSIQVQGKYLQGLTQSKDIPLADDAAWFTPAIPTVGTGTFSTTPESTHTYIHCAGGGNIVGWTVDAAASKWTLADATSINVTISDAGYATLYVPFPVTIPSGVKAYAVGSLTDGLLNLAEITTTIPTGTPVILEGNAGTYAFDIAEEEVAAYSDDNKLEGSYLQKAADNGSYVLQKHDNKVGFYKVDTQVAQPNVPANRAYLPAQDGGVKAFYFGDVETAIKSVMDGMAAGEVYDLSGRKVSKLQRGVNIVNGKKVIVK